MNVHELPMITFTVLAQMSVGAFVVLGIISVFARLSHRYSSRNIDELADPAVLAIGATLVLGLVASMFHMNDVFNVLNVFRHLDSSWLSREIVFGMLFAGSGFLYAVCQILRLGSPRLREALAVVTALIGLALVFVMSMIYASLPTVPAWNTPLTTLRFYTTALLLGAFAVATAFVTVGMLRRRGAFEGRTAERIDAKTSKVLKGSLRDRFGGRELSPDTRSLMLASLRGIAIAGILLLAVEFVLHVLTVGRLTRLGEIGARSAEPYIGTAAVVQIVLAVLGAGLLGLFFFRLAGRSGDDFALSPSESGAATRVAGRTWGLAERVSAVVTLAFCLVLVSEFLARAAFYESNIRIGM